jgi:hypothetical protein
VAKFYNQNSGLKIDYALWKKSLRNSDFSNVFSFGVAEPDRFETKSILSHILYEESKNTDKGENVIEAKYSRRHTFQQYFHLFGNIVWV